MKSVLLLLISITINIILFFIIHTNETRYSIGDVVEIINDNHCRGVGVVIGLLDRSRTGRTSLGLEYIVHMPFCNVNYIIPQDKIRD